MKGSGNDQRNKLSKLGREMGQSVPSSKASKSNPNPVPKKVIVVSSPQKENGSTSVSSSKRKNMHVPSFTTKSAKTSVQPSASSKVAKSSESTSSNWSVEGGGMMVSSLAQKKNNSHSSQGIKAKSSTSSALSQIAARSEARAEITNRIAIENPPKIVNDHNKTDIIIKPCASDNLSKQPSEPDDSLFGLLGKSTKNIVKISLVVESNSQAIPENHLPVAPTPSSFEKSNISKDEFQDARNAPARTVGFKKDDPFENFQKRNLKKKGGAYKTKQKDPRWDKKVFSRNKEKDFGLVEENSDYEDNNKTGESSARGGAARGGNSHGGLANTGLDALHLSLGALKDKNNKKNSQPSNSSLEATNEPKFKSITSKRMKSEHNPHGLTDDFFEYYAPKCPGHQMAAKLLTVKKSGSNRGRRFYSCSFSADSRCDFFMWAEDNPEVLPIILEYNESKESRKSSIMYDDSCAIIAKDPEEEWRRNAVDFYLEKLDNMTTSELKEEVMKCKKRRLLTIGNQRAIDNDQSLVKLTISGRKEEVMNRLAREALRVLDSSAKWKSKVDDLEKSSKCDLTDMVCLDSESLASDGSEINLLEESDDEEISKSSENELLENEETIELDSSEDDCFDRPKIGKSQKTTDKKRNDLQTTSESKSTEPNSSKGEIIQYGERLSSMPQLQRTLVECFGYTQFREGQKWAIQRAIEGQNSLLVMPTGAGKSLCYMVPSIILPGLTLVVSPLISLMQDQLKKLPIHLPGACFSGGMTVHQIAQLTSSLLKGHVKVLYVSPERLCTPAFRKLMRTLNRSALYHTTGSCVSLVCVDEAHCLSQWSYNFRPAFLRIRRELQLLKPGAIMALTATAPPSIQKDVMDHLQIPFDGLLALPSRRPNLQLFARKIDDPYSRRDIILSILKNSKNSFDNIVDEDRYDNATSKPSNISKRKFARMKTDINSNGKVDKVNRNEVPTTIVYVWRRNDVDSLTEYLRSNGMPAVGYHAGMEIDQRKRSQQLFDRGTAKIVVATTAFGMGVDKADVRQVIHNSVPKSVENYLQETGRAGRDNLPATCHMLLYEEDLVLQHSLSHSNRLCDMQVATLLNNVFIFEDDEKKIGKPTLKSKVAVSLKNISNTADISEATVETIISILELPPFGLLQVDGVHLDTVTGVYRISEKLKMMKKNDIIIKAIFELNEIKQQNVYDTWDPKNTKKATSNDTRYGLGNGNNSFQENNLDEDSTLGYDKPPFRISLLALCLHTGLERGEAASGLHSLQTQGVIEYSMSDPAVYVSLTQEGCDVWMQLDADKEEHQHSPKYNLFLTIWNKAHQVTSMINCIGNIDSQRTLDMWRVGKMIQSDTENPISSFQERVSAFLCYYLDNLSGTSAEGRKKIATRAANESIIEKTPDEIQEKEIEVMTRNDDDNNMFDEELNEIFSSCILPFTNCETISQNKEEKAKDLKSIQRVIQDAENLTQDPSMKEMISYLENPWKSFLSHKQGGASELVSKIQGARVEMLVLYISKIMHGLSTPMTGSDYWKSSHHWGRYKEIIFEQLFDTLSAKFSE